MSELESTQALDQITSTQTWQESEIRLKARIANMLGNRTLALVEADSTFDPETYDPALDEADFEAVAA